MKYSKVESSSVNGYFYDASVDTLFIKFNNGAEYAYGKVGKKLVGQFEDAESKGSFLNKKIVSNPDIVCVRIK